MGSCLFFFLHHQTDLFFCSRVSSTEFRRLLPQTYTICHYFQKSKVDTIHPMDIHTHSAIFGHVFLGQKSQNICSRFLPLPNSRCWWMPRLFSFFFTQHPRTQKSHADVFIHVVHCMVSREQWFLGLYIYIHSMSLFPSSFFLWSSSSLLTKQLTKFMIL